MSFEDLTALEVIAFLNDLRANLPNDVVFLTEHIHEIPLDSVHTKNICKLLVKLTPKLESITFDSVRSNMPSDETIYQFALDFAQAAKSVNRYCNLQSVQFNDYSSGGRAKTHGMSLESRKVQQSIIQFVPNFKMTWTISGAIDIPKSLITNIHHLIIIGEPSGSFNWRQLVNVQKLTLRCVPSRVAHIILQQISHLLVVLSLLLLEMPHLHFDQYSWNSIISIKWTFAEGTMNYFSSLPKHVRELRIIGSTSSSPSKFLLSALINFGLFNLTYVHIINLYVKNLNFIGKSGNLYIDPYDEKSLAPLLKLFKNAKKFIITTSRPLKKNHLASWKREILALEDKQISLIVNDVSLLP